MAKFELKFIDVFDSNTVEVFADDYIICICMDEILDGVLTQSVQINLDKSTAIKFAKTLRTEINKITEREVDNG